MPDAVWPNAVPEFRIVKDRDLPAGEMGDIFISEDRNAVARELVAVCNNLGVNPEGSQPTVGERILAIEESAVDKNNVPTLQWRGGDPEDVIAELEYFAPGDRLYWRLPLDGLIFEKNGGGLVSLC